MKKFVVYLFCLLTVVFFIACAGENAVNLDTLQMNEITELSGTTWSMTYTNLGIVKTEFANDSVASTAETSEITEIPLVQTVYTLKFNADNTFEATSVTTWTANMDAQYRDSANVDYSSESYTLNIGSAYGAYSGYSGQEAPGDGGACRITITGYWRKVDTDVQTASDHYYTKGYDLKVTGYTYKRIIPEADNGASGADNVFLDYAAGYLRDGYTTPNVIDNGEATILNSDADWVSFDISDLTSDGPAADGVELTFTGDGDGALFILPYSNSNKFFGTTVYVREGIFTKQ